MMKACLICLVILLSFSLIKAKKSTEDDKPKWTKKNIRDYNDADMERLLDQWEEDEEPLEPDELPEHLRPQPKFDFDPALMKDPESLLKLSKKGKTVMMFVKLKSNYNKDQVEDVTKLWQGSLHNSHIQAERYMVDDSRAIFMFSDGSLAWEAKDFLVQQEELEDCTIDNKVYHGLYTDGGKEEKEQKSSKSKKKKTEL